MRTSLPKRFPKPSPGSGIDFAWVLVSLGVAFAALWLGPCSALAQDTHLPDLSVPCAPEVVARRAVIAHEGAPGIWFDLRVAQCMMGRLDALPLYAQRVSLLEQRLTLSDERHQLMERQVELAEQGEQAAVDALEAAVRRAREAEEERDAWYRAPLLWFIVGGVVVIVLEALAIWALSELRIPTLAGP